MQPDQLEPIRNPSRLELGMPHTIVFPEWDTNGAAMLHVVVHKYSDGRSGLAVRDSSMVDNRWRIVSRRFLQLERFDRVHTNRDGSSVRYVKLVRLPADTWTLFRGHLPRKILDSLSRRSSATANEANA